MSLAELLMGIQDRSARLAVIGLGYVGLPVACEFAHLGFDVLGIELRPQRVAAINACSLPMDGEEPGLADLLAEVVRAGHLRADTDYTSLHDRDIVLIDVETPVDDTHAPRYDALRSVLHALNPVLKSGALVIVESTIAPGTMHSLVCPLLESGGKVVGRDFYLGNCPERVMPGKLLTNLRGLSRVVGGWTPETARVMLALYGAIVQADLDPVDCVTAEIVKTAENAYRDVQIAFANEVALICEALGGDVWKVRDLVNKSPFRQMHLPGAGVGGHCIPKDPWLLAYGVQKHHVPLRLIPAARAVNSGMPGHVANLLTDLLAEILQPLDNARILVLGLAYLEDTDDTRNSPSELLVQHLDDQGAQVVVHDPYVTGYQGDLFATAATCDAAVVMVRHSQYLTLDWPRLAAALRHPLLVDGRHLLSPEAARAAGFVYRGIGIAAAR